MKLSGKHIVIGITGGIAAYKSANLVRLFVKSGAEVQVIMTPHAKEFITPVTLSTLSGKPVISEFFTANTGEWHSHVDLGLWADAFIVAPATASTIAKMATGVADNMLVTSYLSTRAKVFVAPAMDMDMMMHPSTVRNIETLRSDGCTIIEPAEGELASHLIGKGRMEEPDAIFRRVATFLIENEKYNLNPEINGCDGKAAAQLKNKRVLITAGPTRERLDPVRFISNYSTGKMGVAIADEAARRGADVTLVLGPCNASPTESGVMVVNVESARDMLDVCERYFPSTDIAIMCAAVADYTVAHPSEVKIKRENNEIPSFEFVKNPDIAAILGKRKRDNQYMVGFALETDHENVNAIEKLNRKNLNMIVMNSLRDEGAGFGTDTNKVTIHTSDGRSKEFGLKDKKAVASDIWDSILENTNG
ncbi:MAG: bifunctional phosphopantothenoylcysteine decarboxylase/phosphopantothenate--cysteine ligase CoaBC [Bacteroidales bacterium]|nr:bifunctional phosphopantothenoylcysteine decarboxylase/phosphopantothenate--cysteine ligase CoaBC [Bacteroidales bacterium]